MTERKNDGGVRLDWLERKSGQLDHLAEASADEAALKAADAVHNIESTLRDLRRLGLGVLDRFRGGALTVWHYSAIAELAAGRMAAGAPLAAACRTRHAVLDRCRPLRSARDLARGPAAELQPPPGARCRRSIGPRQNTTSALTLSVTWRRPHRPADNSNTVLGGLVAAQVAAEDEVRLRPELRREGAPRVSDWACAGPRALPVVEPLAADGAAHPAGRATRP